MTIRSTCRGGRGIPRRQAGVAVGQPRRDSRRHAGGARRGVRARLGAAVATGDSRAAHRQRARNPGRGLHRRPRVRRRRADVARRVLESRHLRQARSARRSVLRGDDLRDAVTRRCRRAARDRRGGRCGRDGARAGARADPRGVPRHASASGEPPRVHVLEVAARPIGGLCSRVLRFAVGTADRPCRSSTCCSVTRSANDVVPAREDEAAAVMMIPIPRRGHSAGRWRGRIAARAVPHVEDVRITAKQDQLLEPLPEAGSYLGFVFARAPLPSEAESAVREAHRRLVFTVDGAIDVRAG